ncbi:unnamed protein product [Urochloa humidicola]
MLLRTGKRLKRAPPGGGHDDDDDGLPLADEILLHIFAGGVLDTYDLARCAGTCRRWRRLVSSEASFLCRSNPARYVPVGFFHQGEKYGVHAVPRFFPLAPYPAATKFAREPLASSRLVTARKGRLVLELYGGGGASRLRLAVCDPLAGDVAVLPALAGRDRPGRYACVLLTASDDTDNGLAAADAAEGTPSPFRVVIVYARRGFTACRAYSSEDGSWGPEREVSGARVSGRSLAQAHAAAVVCAGGAVFWRVGDAVLGLRLDGGTMAEATLEPLPEDWTRNTTRRDGEGCGGVLAVWPANRSLCLCVVEPGMRRSGKDVVKVQVLFRVHGNYDGSDDDDEKWDGSRTRSATVALQVPSGCYGRISRVCLRGLCEKSGVVFLAAGFASYVCDRQWEALYAVDLDKMEARLLDGIPDAVGGTACRVGSGATTTLHGYEMYRVAYLEALGNKRRGKGKMTMDVEDIYDFC